MGNIEPIFGIGDFVDHFAIFGIDGAGGGKIFPFFFDTLVGVKNVAGLEVAIAFGELTILDYAATDTGREGEIKRATFGMVCLGERSEISVVFDVDGEAEIFFELFGDVEIVPVEIAEPDGDVAFDDAWHSNGARLDVRDAEIDTDLLAEIFVKLALVLNSGEFDRMKDIARGVDEGDKSLGTSDIDT